MLSNIPHVQLTRDKAHLKKKLRLKMCSNEQYMSQGRLHVLGKMSIVCGFPVKLFIRWFLYNPMSSHSNTAIH